MKTRTRKTIVREIAAAAGGVTRMQKRCQCHGNSTGRARKMMQARLAACTVAVARLESELVILDLRQRDIDHNPVL